MQQFINSGDGSPPLWGSIADNLNHLIGNSGSKAENAVEGIHDPKAVQPQPFKVFRRWEEGLRILIVDDSSSNRKVMARSLTNQGHTVEHAEDGLEFVALMETKMPQLDRLENAPFDVVLMDFQMPKMNGAEATKAVRERRYAGLIVGVSGNTLAEDVEHFIAHGADDVLPKPLKLNRLQEIILRHSPPLQTATTNMNTNTKTNPEIGMVACSANFGRFFSNHRKIDALSSHLLIAACWVNTTLLYT